MEQKNLNKFGKLLSAHIDPELCDRFLQQAHMRCIVKKRALAGAVRLWTELPTDLQARLLDRTTEENTFTDLVRQIVDERLGKSKKEPAPQVQKQSRQQLREAMARLKEMVEIENKQPGTIYRVLDSSEQKVLDDFRRMMSDKERRKSRSA
jgi:hypothetical protein